MAPPYHSPAIRATSEAIAEMLDEADRRDPARVRTAVALADGNDSQDTAIYDEGPPAPSALVLDIIHVIEGACHHLIQE